MFAKFRPKIEPLEPSTKKPVFLGLGVTLFTSLIFAAAFFTFLPPQVPLFYSRPWGEGQLVQPLFLTLPLVLGIIFIIVNALFAKRLEDSFLKQALVFGGVLTSLFAAITVIRILLLVF